MPKFHIEYWNGVEWNRISGTRGHDNLRAAELQKRTRAKAWGTTEENFSIVCTIDP